MKEGALSFNLRDAAIVEIKEDRLHLAISPPSLFHKELVHQGTMFRFPHASVSKVKVGP